MPQLSSSFVRAATRWLFKPFVGPPWPITFQRGWVRMISAINRPSPDARTEWVDVEGCRAMVCTPEGHEPEHVVLYLHGGGYCFGSPGTHKALITHLAVAADARVVALDYRLAPKHPFPAAVDDARAAYRGLLDTGVSPRRIVVAGDSAGGGLTLAAAIAIRDDGLPGPAGLVLISPWVNLTEQPASRRDKADVEVMLRKSLREQCAAAYVADRKLEDPGCSPLFADLRGLPPTLIQVGTHEALLDDSTELDVRARDSGIDVSLRVFDGMWHVFQTSAGTMLESDEAVAEIATFMRSRWS